MEFNCMVFYSRLELNGGVFLCSSALFRSKQSLMPKRRLFQFPKHLEFGHLNPRLLFYNCSKIPDIFFRDYILTSSREGEGWMGE